ncbi:MAG: RNA polymerase sigma factor [Comamonadaceae bacterium]|nr:RNA polymerase sigma factor [Comamonadaceae bacterium]
MTDDQRLFDEHIPRLRRYARALTGDRTRADDLVQDCPARAWEKLSLWRRGTDLRAWLFTILHNLYVNDVRRLKSRPELLALDDTALEVPHHASIEGGLALRDLDAALRQPARRAARGACCSSAWRKCRYAEVARTPRRPDRHRDVAPVARPRAAAHAAQRAPARNCAE